MPILQFTTLSKTTSISVTLTALHGGLLRAEGNTVVRSGRIIPLRILVGIIN